MKKIKKAHREVDSKFRGLTSLNQEQYKEILPVFSDLVAKKMAEYNLKGKRREFKARRERKDSSLYGAESKLDFLLVYLSTMNSFKALFKIIFEVLAIVVAVQMAYWIAADYVLFNAKTLDLDLEFLYYLSPSLVALVLTIITIYLFEKIKSFGSNLLLVLINTYSFSCILMLTSEYCDLNKNLDRFYSLLVALILILISILLMKNILSKMIWKNIAIVITATIISLYDFLILLIGYKVFYPGFW